MQKGNIAAYKYDDKNIPSLIIKWKWFLPILLGFVAIVVLFLRSWGLHPGSIFLAITLISVSIVGFYSLNYRNEVVIISADYFFMGGRVYLYRNIKRFKKDQSELIIEMKDGRCCQIKKESFPTSARKDFKIEKNKKEKFDKVSSKIIERVKAINPQVTIKDSGS